MSQTDKADQDGPLQLHQQFQLRAMCGAFQQASSEQQRSLLAAQMLHNRRQTFLANAVELDLAIAQAASQLATTAEDSRSLQAGELKYLTSAELCECFCAEAEYGLKLQNYIRAKIAEGAYS